VANLGSNSITEYPTTATGNATPVATISGTATGIDAPSGITIDAAGNLVVPNSGNSTVTEYAAGASGNSAPFATLSGASTSLASPTFAALVTPSANTGAASAVTASSASLNGTVNPNGAATRVLFQYGTTKAYGKATPSKGAGSGASPVSTSAAIGSLTPATTYHFRLVASSDAGTRLGADATFTTP
jgi:hypothetical protein